MADVVNQLGLEVGDMTVVVFLSIVIFVGNSMENGSIWFALLALFLFIYSCFAHPALSFCITMNSFVAFM